MKKLFSYLFIIAFICSFWINVKAFDRDYNVQDYSNTLSEKELERIKDRAEEYYNDTGFEVIILIYSEGYSDYQLERIGRNYFDEKYSKSYGAYLVLDVKYADDNEYYFHFDGSDDYYSESEKDKILDDIRAVKYDGTAAICEQFAKSVNKYSNANKSKMPYILLVVLPLTISGITIFILINKNKMVRKATTAAAYLNKDEINFTRKEDRFVTTHVTRVPINTGSGGGSHGGGSHGMSGGRGGRL